MTVIDIAGFDAGRGGRIPLAGIPDRVSAAGVGSSESGFSSFGSVFVEARAHLAGSVAGATPALTVLVEESDDGSSWSTVTSFVFAASGSGRFEHASPKDYMRASWSSVAGAWSAVAVDVIPAEVNAPGGNGGSQPAQFKQQISFQRTPPSVITIPDSTWTALDFTDAIILQHGNPNPISADVSDGMLTLPKETANVWSVFSIVEFVQNNGGGVRACDLLYQQGVLGDDIAGGVTPAIHDALVGEEGGFYVVATWVQDPDNDLVFAPTVYQDSGGDLNVLNWKFSFQVIG